MTGYSAREVGRVLDLSRSQVRWYLRAGLVEPRRGTRGELWFSFQDLAFLRTAKGLMASPIPPRRVRVALRRLRTQLPREHPLSGVQISVEGDRILARDGQRVWDPESGQVRFDFGDLEEREKITAHAPRICIDTAVVDRVMTADDWCEMGAELEDLAIEESREAYRRALEIDPRHVGAHVGLGRVLDESGDHASAERHFRMAVETNPRSADAHVALGDCLERLGRDGDAIACFRQCLRVDSSRADVCFRLARVHERLGDTRSALLWLEAYRELSETPEPRG